MISLKITEKGWAGFTGPLCQVEFVDGVTVHPVAQVMADRVAAIVQCEVLDENGEHAGQAGYAARHPQGQTIGMPVEQLETISPEQLAAERKAAVDKELRNPAAKIYTVSELEEIASKSGINGLRKEVGDKWNVKERSISKLIGLIMQVQGEYQSRKEERDAGQRKAREAAEAEALAKAAQVRQEFDEQCRGILNKDELTATVDPAKVPANEWDGVTDPNQDPDAVAKLAAEQAAKGSA